MSKDPRTRAQVALDTAVALVESDGEQALGWNRVAQALGVKPPSLYNYFESATELRVRVALRAWEMFATMAEQAVARCRTPETSLRAIAVAYRALAKEHPGMFAVMSNTRIELTHPEFSVIAARTMGLFNGALEEMGVAPSRRVHAIRALRAAIHGFVVLEASGQFNIDASVDTSFRTMIHGLVTGLRSSAPESD